MADQRLKDRKLGDEWVDWSGDLADHDGDIEEGRRTILLFSSISLFLFLVGVLFLWYLITPRLAMWNPRLPRTMGRVLITLIGLVLALFVLTWLSILTERRNFLPYRVMETFLGYMASWAIWLGGYFGMSRDRMSSSFIKASNSLVRASYRGGQRKSVLVLIPRCLTKAMRDIALELSGKYQCQIHTAGGGEQARELVREHRPEAVVGIACERDLISGIRDVAPKIPVIGIANKRPEGPCKNTHIKVEELEDALRTLTGKEGENPQMEPD
ncbi:MAG: DUF116 domain-containing protein [candidate division NC10 bacterium]|nr:DUF116 domain-containing protein [candidate division NC10 bacterium]